MLQLRSKIPQRQRPCDWSFAYSHPDRWGNKSEPISHPRLPCPLGTRQVPPDRRAIPKIYSPVRHPNVASSPSDQIGLRSSELETGVALCRLVNVPSSGISRTATYFSS